MRTNQKSNYGLLQNLEVLGFWLKARPISIGRAQARKTSETDTLQFLKFKQRYVKMEGKMNSF